MRFHQACNLIAMCQHVPGAIYLDMPVSRLLIIADCPLQIAALEDKLLLDPTHLPEFTLHEEVEVVAILEYKPTALRALPVLELLKKHSENIDKNSAE